jgi:ABC-type transporter MlaC component
MVKSKVVLGCAIALCSLLAAPQAMASPATEAFIQQNFDKGYEILNSTKLSEAQRRGQFRALLLNLVATRRFALFALGPYASGATPQQLDRFVEAFKNYGVSLYEKMLNRYDGQSLHVTGSSDRTDDDSTVQADIINRDPVSARPISVAFRLRPNETGMWAVTDIVFEGVSVATLARVQLTAMLFQHNGDVSELSRALNAMR